jgi:hypothetical protein
VRPVMPPRGVASAVVCGQASRTWRRHLGVLAWAALEELALTARRDVRGWASPTEVRAIATGIGTTDTAAVRALAALAVAGLVVLEARTDQDGWRRCGYRLHTPPGVELLDGPGEHDTVSRGLRGDPPNGHDTRSLSLHHRPDTRCPAGVRNAKGPASPGPSSTPTRMTVSSTRPRTLQARPSSKAARRCSAEAKTTSFPGRK